MLPSERLDEFGWCAVHLENPITGARCAVGSLVEYPNSADFSMIPGADSGIDYDKIIAAARSVYGDEKINAVVKVATDYLREHLLRFDERYPYPDDATMLFTWNDHERNDFLSIRKTLKEAGL